MQPRPCNVSSRHSQATLTRHAQRDRPTAIDTVYGAQTQTESLGSTTQKEVPERRVSRISVLSTDVYEYLSEGKPCLWWETKTSMLSRCDSHWWNGPGSRGSVITRTKPREIQLYTNNRECPPSYEYNMSRRIFAATRLSLRRQTLLKMTDAS